MSIICDSNDSSIVRGGTFFIKEQPRQPIVHAQWLPNEENIITDTGMKHPWNLSLPSCTNCTLAFLFSEEEKIDHGNRSELIKVILGTMEIRFIRRFLFRHAAVTWQRSYVVFLVIFILFYFSPTRQRLFTYGKYTNLKVHRVEREKEIWIGNGMLLMSFLFARREPLRVVWTPVGEHKSSRRSCEFYQ
jgi:hypothetical protein